MATGISFVFEEPQRPRLSVGPEKYALCDAGIFLRGRTQEPPTWFEMDGSLRSYASAARGFNGLQDIEEGLGDLGVRSLIVDLTACRSNGHPGANLDSVLERADSNGEFKLVSPNGPVDVRIMSLVYHAGQESSSVLLNSPNHCIGNNVVLPWDRFYELKKPRELDAQLTLIA